MAALMVNPENVFESARRGCLHVRSPTRACANRMKAAGIKTGASFFVERLGGRMLEIYKQVVDEHKSADREKHAWEILSKLAPG